MQEKTHYQHFAEDNSANTDQHTQHTLPISVGVPIKHYDPYTQGTLSLGQQYIPLPTENFQVGYPQQMITENQVAIGNQITQDNTLDHYTQGATIVAAEKFGEVARCEDQLLEINSRNPQAAFCPKCKKYVQTVVKYHVGTGTILSAALLALLGAWMGCCLIPCCLKECKDAVHTCPVCNFELGRRKFIVN